MAFYQANGWKCGRNSMKDWKAAVITWEKRQRKDSKPQRGNGQAQSWEQTIDAMAGQLGMSAKPGETYQQFGARVRGAMTRAH